MNKGLLTNASAFQKNQNRIVSVVKDEQLNVQEVAQILTNAGVTCRGNFWSKQDVQKAIRERTKKTSDFCNLGSVMQTCTLLKNERVKKISDAVVELFPLLIKETKNVGRYSLEVLNDYPLFHSVEVMSNEEGQRLVLSFDKKGYCLGGFINGVADMEIAVLRQVLGEMCGFFNCTSKYFEGYGYEISIPLLQGEELTRISQITHVLQKGLVHFLIEKLEQGPTTLLSWGMSAHEPSMTLEMEMTETVYTISGVPEMRLERVRRFFATLFPHVQQTELNTLKIYLTQGVLPPAKPRTDGDL